MGTGEPAEGGGDGDGDGDGNDVPTLARLSVTVSMVPRAWASEAVLANRRQGFLEGKTFNHSPHEAGTSSGTVTATRKFKYVPIELTDAQRALL